MIRLRSATTRRRRSRDAGLSLVELMVTMAISSIVLAGVSTVFIGAVRTLRSVQAQTSSSADARIGMEAITRSLRVAIRPEGQPSALVSATSNGITFFAMINRTGADTTAALTPTKIAYAYDAGTACLNETRTPASGAAPYVWTTGSTTRCLLRSTVAPTFAYYTTPVLATGGVDIAPLTVPGGGLAAAELLTVQSIQVTLVVKDPANPTLPGVTSLSRITLTNVISTTGGS